MTIKFMDRENWYLARQQNDCLFWFNYLINDKVDPTIANMHCETEFKMKILTGWSVFLFKNFAIRIYVNQR